MLKAYFLEFYFQKSSCFFTTNKRNSGFFFFKLLLFFVLFFAIDLELPELFPQFSTFIFYNLSFADRFLLRLSIFHYVETLRHAFILKDSRN